MTDKQKAFIDEYLLTMNATQSAIKAGYSARSAYSIGEELLRKPEVKKAIDAEMTKRHDDKIMSRENLMQFWSDVIQDEDNSMKDRLRASELLGKSQAVFVEKVEATAEITEHKTLADLMIEEYERSK